MIGFIGLGVMGEPMALNLLRAGTRLVVWNRTLRKTAALTAAGARAAESARAAFEQTRTIILMLGDEAAIDSVLDRGRPAFARLVENRTIVHMGTTSPDHSRRLAADIDAAGGRYAEAPVSGSRKPAEAGELVAMLAGDPDAIDAVRPLLAPMCRQAVMCGPVPNALSMKLASNLFVITMLTGLAEAIHYADRQGLDLDQFTSLLGAGPMASELLRMKTPKLVARDFAVQGSVDNVIESHRLITDTARQAGIALPLIETSHALFREAAQLGLGRSDVVAVLRAIEERSARRRTERP